VRARQVGASLIDAHHVPAFARLMPAALLGFVAGSAIQLQQGALYAWQTYACFMLFAHVLLALIAIKNIANSWQLIFATLSFCVLAFGLSGLRSAIFVSNALDANLQGRDLIVTGVVASMPQSNEAGLRPGAAAHWPNLAAPAGVGTSASA
jgi:competence protein ComEC